MLMDQSKPHCPMCDSQDIYIVKRAGELCLGCGLCGFAFMEREAVWAIDEPDCLSGEERRRLQDEAFERLLRRLGV